MKIQGRTMFFHVFVLSLLVSLFLKTTSIGFLILRYKVFYTAVIKKTYFHPFSFFLQETERYILFIENFIFCVIKLQLKITLYSCNCIGKEGFSIKSFQTVSGGFEIITVFIVCVRLHFISGRKTKKWTSPLNSALNYTSSN